MIDPMMAMQHHTPLVHMIVLRSSSGDPYRVDANSMTLFVPRNLYGEEQGQEQGQGQGH